MNTNIDSLALELAGIRDSLFLLGGEFAKKNNPCKWDNDTISGMINALAYHVERISTDLDNLSAGTVQK